MNEEYVETTATKDVDVATQLEIAALTDKFDACKFNDDPTINMLYMILKLLLKTDGVKDDILEKFDKLCMHIYRAGIITGTTMLIDAMQTRAKRNKL